MSKVLKKINQYVANAEPSDYENVSYNTYFATLADISNTYLEEKETLKAEVLRIADDEIRLKLLELL